MNKTRKLIDLDNETIKVLQPVGRPTINETDRKHTYTVSLTSARKAGLCIEYGSLTKALETVLLTSKAGEKKL